MDKKKRSSKKIAAVALLSAGALLASFGGTWAYYQSEQSLINPLATPNTGVVMVEDFNPNQSFLPGETAVKEVKFENTGDMDLFLRVEVMPKEEWYKKGSGGLEPAAGLEPEYVIKNWTASWTTEKDNRIDVVPEEELPSVKVPRQIYDEHVLEQMLTDGNVFPAGIIKDDLSTMPEGWGETGDWTKAYQDPITHKWYRYYKKILLKKSEETGRQTPPILKSITLSTAVTNDRHDVDYSDKVYLLQFDAQAVPVEGEDVQDLDSGETLAVQTGVQAEWKMRVTSDSNGNLTWTPLSTTP